MLRSIRWDAALPSEAHLLRMAREGQRDAFDQLVRLHAEPLRAFVQQRVPPEVADDIVQETWIAAWSHLGNFSARARFRTWLYAIAANKCRDWRRAERPSVHLEETEDSVGDAPSRASDAQADVARALSQLTPTLREVIDLYYFEDMNLREIAEITATNLNTVKYRFYRAHRDMADLLGDWNG